jgi:plasmid maintenance system antidote protein VapI
METLTGSQVVVRNVTEIMSGETGEMIAITKSQLARELGWSRQRLQKLFDRSRISVNELMALADALRVSPGRLISPQRAWNAALLPNEDNPSSAIEVDAAADWVIWGQSAAN